jgi:predicted dehydrogenase
MAGSGTTRRRFLGIGAALAAGTALSRTGLDAREGGQPGRQEHRLGVALVGLGTLSTYQLAPALERTRRCRLAGIVTGTPAKAAAWKARYGLPDRSVYDYDTMEGMAENADIDLVHVATPNALHAEHTMRAARAGKHVLCEKPMEVTVARCQQMIDACRAAGRQLAIGYRCRFEPHHVACARLASERTFGAVRIVEAGFGFPIGDPNQWRLDPALSGGGPLMDVGIYALQSARMFTGEEPEVVTALATTTDPMKFGDVEESLTFQLRFPGGALADCRTTYRVPGVNRASVYADEGSFGLDPAYNYGGLRGWRSDGEPLRFDAPDPFAAELDAFAAHILAGTPTTVPGEEGLRDLRIMMAIYEAARTGRAVRLA